MSEEQANSEKREAILFIPAFSLRKEKSSLYYLGKEFKKYGAKEMKSFEKDGFKAKEFRINDRLIDVYEVYWTNLVEDITKLELTEKVPRGVTILFYWVFSGIYRAIKESKLLILLFTLFLFVFVFWYFITILLIFSQLVKELDVDALKGFKPTVGWIWLINTFLLGLLPVSDSANLSNFCRQYFEDEFFEYELNQRILKALNLAFENNYYSITIVGHSMGAVVATNVLADISKERNIRYITIGSPLKFFSLKSHKIQVRLLTLVEGCKSKVSQWTDYYSDQDLVCIKWLPVGKYENLEVKSIQLNNEKGKKIHAFSSVSLTGQSHSFYIYSSEIIQNILNIMGG